MDQSGSVQRLVLDAESTEWAIMYSLPNDPCDNYGYSGANGICRNSHPICMCLQGFTPRSQEEWEVFNTSSGCMRRIPLVCHGGEGFSQLLGVKLPGILEFSLNKSMNIEECRVKCLMNCSCTAYANSDISGVASGCIMWFGDLVDVTVFIDEDKIATFRTRCVLYRYLCLIKSNFRGHS
ncbi:hypothetical protein Pyn_06782 [Prunus yedoensis var. nudiflora]|uniref:Apple domain-containing protein n=1 Tax=Prunus yedoensis var. nudiflora TaxID=2094558 RepID=A0A314YRH3_PRUYE|nr:hypothetical protein Pyn_06782 [Prunus yedoensis var. nudiflora]